MSPNLTPYTARAEIVQIIAASVLPRIKCNDAIAPQPAGSCGFRKGEWTVLFDGTPKKIFMSIPHSAALIHQYEIARQRAATAVGWEMLKAAGWE